MIAAASYSRRGIFLVCVSLLVTGCSGIALTTAAPENFNISGHWELLPSLSDPVPRTRDLRRRGLAISFVAQDFPVVSATTMTVEQNIDSMGVRYSQGSYRDVSWGTRERGLWKTDAGWNDGLLYIISEASDATATETIRLESGGDRLVVNIDIEADGESLSVTRVFRRVY